MISIELRAALVTRTAVLFYYRDNIDSRIYDVHFHPRAFSNERKLFGRRLLMSNSSFISAIIVIVITSLLRWIFPNQTRFHLWLFWFRVGWYCCQKCFFLFYILYSLTFNYGCFFVFDQLNYFSPFVNGKPAVNLILTSELMAGKTLG